jgi:hypothetical protein
MTAPTPSRCRSRPVRSPAIVAEIEEVTQTDQESRSAGHRAAPSMTAMDFTIRDCAFGDPADNLIRIQELR